MVTLRPVEQDDNVLNTGSKPGLKVPHERYRRRDSPARESGHRPTRCEFCAAAWAHNEWDRGADIHGAPTGFVETAMTTNSAQACIANSLPSQLNRGIDLLRRDCCLKTAAEMTGCRLPAPGFVRVVGNPRLSVRCARIFGKAVSVTRTACRCPIRRKEAAPKRRRWDISQVTSVARPVGQALCHVILEQELVAPTAPTTRVYRFPFLAF